MSIPEIAIWIVLVVAGLSLAMMLIFGFRGVASGKVSITTMISIAVPVVLLVALGFTMGDWERAAIYTLVICLALTTVAMFLSGVRGLFG